jgi:AcrR family transcriptional regulator
MNKQEMRRTETRNRIIEAAALCFAESGYDGTAVARICETAGVSKGAFYHHFSSKQQLFIVLIDQWLEDLDQHLVALGGQVDDPAGQLLAMTRVIGQIIQLPNQQLLIYLEFLNRAFHDPQVLQATTRPFHRYRQQIAGIIETGIEDGTFKTASGDSAASIVIALAIGLLIQGFLDPTAADWEQVSQEGMELLLTGMRGKS